MRRIGFTQHQVGYGSADNHDGVAVRPENLAEFDQNSVHGANAAIVVVDRTPGFN
jgi:hypothetical protein